MKLTAFRIAKALNEAPVTSTRTLTRTIKCMSPEQTPNTIVDRRTDLDSLGMVFNEMVTGQNLWEETPNLTILKNLQAESTIPPLNFPPEIPLETQAAIEGLLQHYPNDRIQTAKSFIARLEDVRPLWSNSSSDQQEEDSNTTILTPRTEKPEIGKDDKTVTTLSPCYPPPHSKTFHTSQRSGQRTH